MSSSFYMILDMLVAMAALGYGGPLPLVACRLIFIDTSSSSLLEQVLDISTETQMRAVLVKTVFEDIDRICSHQ